jgi:tryptophan synthase alpha chain
VATVLLVAPSTPTDRIGPICDRSRGFVYGVGRMGVTGERAVLAASAREVAARVRAVTDLPVCVGIGVSTPEQAATVCEVADGVVVGSALVRRLLEGEGPDGAAAFVSALRQALDAG